MPITSANPSPLEIARDYAASGTLHEPSFEKLILEEKLDILDIAKQTIGAGRTEAASDKSVAATLDHVHALTEQITAELEAQKEELSI